MGPGNTVLVPNPACPIYPCGFVIASCSLLAYDAHRWLVMVKLREIPMSPHHRRALTLSISLAALLYLGFVLLADRAAVFAALRRVGAPVLAAIFGLSLLNYLLRFWRWIMLIIIHIPERLFKRLKL